jgi:hypothetical protein
LQIVHGDANILRPSLDKAEGFGRGGISRPAQIKPQGRDAARRQIVGIGDGAVVAGLRVRDRDAREPVPIRVRGRIAIGEVVVQRAKEVIDRRAGRCAPRPR